MAAATAFAGAPDVDLFRRSVGKGDCDHESFRGLRLELGQRRSTRFARSGHSTGHVARHERACGSPEPGRMASRMVGASRFELSDLLRVREAL